MKKSIAFIAIVSVFLNCSNNGVSSSTSSLDNGLIGYYPFNGNAKNLSGQGNNGTIYGATPTADRFGNPACAFRFNGIDNYITFSWGWLFPDIEGFTVSAWVYAEDTTRGMALYTGAGMGECQISVDERGLLFAVKLIDDTSKYSNGWFTAIPPLISGRFVHVAGVYRRGHSIQLRIDGALAQEISIPENDLFHGLPEYAPAIGSYSPNHFYKFRGMWLGVIDDVRIYGRALTETEIQNLHATEK